MNNGVWITAETLVDGKLRRAKVAQRGKRGVKADDSFVVEWYEGKKRCREKLKLRGIEGKDAAFDRADEIAKQLANGGSGGRMKWDTFRKRFESSILKEKNAQTQRLYKDSLNLFEEIISPASLKQVTPESIDRFRAGLLERRGKNRESTMAPTSVNKHLRHLRAVLNQAGEWGLMKAPKIRFCKEPRKLPVFVTPDQFDAIFAACESAQYPVDPDFSAADWWRALLATLVMTGLRIQEALTLPWASVTLGKPPRDDMADDPEANHGTIRLHYDSTKTGEEACLPLHPAAVVHLRRIASHGEFVFDWGMCETTLYDEWTRIQKKAGIHVPCREAGKHECTPRCHVFGFHSLRKSTATLNASRLGEAALGFLMRHGSPSTTRKYYANSTEVLKGVEQALFVPASLRAPL